MSEHRTIDKSAEIIFEKVLKKVPSQLEIKRKDSALGVRLLSRFDEVNQYEGLYVHKVTEFRGTKSSFLIALIEKHLTIIQSKKYGRVKKEIEEVEPVLIFSIPKDIGKIYMRRETVADKVTDLFTKIDIDFAEYPKFSRKYYVAGEHPELVKQHMPKFLIETMEKVEDVIVEINGNWGLVRTEKNLTEELLLKLISVGQQMTV